nr:ABC-2 family transporter protein [Actinopolymorpha rutila]
MPRLPRLLRLVWLSVWRSSLSQWSWRSFMVTLVVGEAVTPLLGLFVWSAALPGDPTVSTYYVVLLAVQLMTVSYEHHTLSNGIYDGNLAAALVQPQPLVVDIFGANVGLRIWHLIFGLPLIVVAAVFTGVRVEPAAVALAIPALLLAALLRFAFTYALALSALWTQRAHGVVGLGETLIFLLGGTAAPLSLLPDPYRSLGSVLPFWSMLGMPAEIAAGNLHGSALAQAYGVQIGWLVLVTAVVTAVWRLGLRRFTAVGG